MTVFIVRHMGEVKGVYSTSKAAYQKAADLDKDFNKHYYVTEHVVDMDNGEVTKNSSRKFRLMKSKKSTCSICCKETQYCCADCMIDKGKKVYVCEDPKCRDKHEESGCI